MCQATSLLVTGMMHVYFSLTELPVFCGQIELHLRKACESAWSGVLGACKHSFHWEHWFFQVIHRDQRSWFSHCYSEEKKLIPKRTIGTMKIMLNDDTFYSGSVRRWKLWELLGSKLLKHIGPWVANVAWAGAKVHRSLKKLSSEFSLLWTGSLDEIFSSSAQLHWP